MQTAPPPPDTLARLADHRALRGVPSTELEWLVAHGELKRFEEGEYLGRMGQALDEVMVGLAIVLSGRFAIHVDRGMGSRRVMEWQAGDLTGILPFSRMNASPGNSLTETRVEILSIPRTCFGDLIRECPEVTARCVHTMLDRARVFNTNEWQIEKMASLGRLAAGLAHELNNPAAAVARSATRLEESIVEADRAVRRIARAGLTDTQLEALDRIRLACTRTAADDPLPPLERARREDEIADWLDRHGADDSALDALVETSVTLDALDDLAAHLPGPALDAALDWVAAGCDIRRVAAENEFAASRISDLVGAMKRLTYMDRAPVPEPLDIRRDLHEVVTILGHKARAKSVGVVIDIAPDLSTVHAVGGELNQVWMNLLDNAIDAVDDGGAIRVEARQEGRSLVVRVIDDGPGIPEEDQSRVFDPFFTTKPPGEGTGLGLEIARNRLRGNGGDLDFDSVPGRTEFRVMLPVRE